MLLALADQRIGIASLRKLCDQVAVLLVLEAIDQTDEEVVVDAGQYLFLV